MNIQTVVGCNVRYFRKQRTWTQEKLASEAGLHRTYVGGIERGERNISMNNVAKLASALDVHPARLLVDQADTDIRSAFEEN